MYTVQSPQAKVGEPTKLFIFETFYFSFSTFKWK